VKLAEAFIVGYFLLILQLLSLKRNDRNKINKYWLSPRMVWDTLIVISILCIAINLVPTTPRNNIRVDLVIIDFLVFPTLWFIAIAGVFKSKNNNEDNP
jgi:hypothetical protein